MTGRVTGTGRSAGAVARAARVAVAASLTTTFAVVAWAMATNSLGQPLPPVAPVVVVALLNVVTLVLLVALRPAVIHLVLAVSWGAVTALPWLSPIVQVGLMQEGGTAPLMALAAGTAAAVAALAGLAITDDRVRVVATTVTTAVVLLSLFLGLVTLLGGPGDGSYLRNERTWLNVWQLRGVAGHPNVLAAIATLALLLQIDAFRRQAPTLTRRGRLSFLVAGPVATLVVLAWTQSRTGWISAALAVVVYTLPWRRDGKGVLAALVVVGGVVAALGPPVLGARGTTFNGRSFAWEIAWDWIAWRPLTGPGVQVYSREFWDTYGPELRNLPVSNWDPAHAHNLFLQAGVLLGVLGWLLLVVAVAAAAVVAVTARRRDHGLALAALTALLVSAGVEAALGVGPGGAVYLPGVVVALVLGTQAGPQATTGPRSPGHRQSRGLPFGGGRGGRGGRGAERSTAG